MKASEMPLNQASDLGQVGLRALSRSRAKVLGSHESAFGRLWGKDVGKWIGWYDVWVMQ